MTNTRESITIEVVASEEVDDSKNFKQSFSIIMAKANEQYEEILDELSILKSKNIASEQRLANIESLLAKLLQKESPPPVTPDMNSSKATIPYSTLMDAVYDGIESYGFENEISQASINGLLTGEITLYGDYISVAVHLYQFPGAKLSCSVIEVGSVSDLVSLAAMIARDLTPKIANSLPVKIVFEFENDKIFDEVDISAR